MKNFDVVQRPHGKCWMHKTKPMWIVYYPLAKQKPYRAYRVKGYELPVPSGRAPWTLDNTYVGNAPGYETLEEAMQAIEDAV